MESLEGSSKSMCDVVQDIQQSNTCRTDMKVKDCIEKGGQRPCSYPILFLYTPFAWRRTWPPGFPAISRQTVDGQPTD